MIAVESLHPSFVIDYQGHKTAVMLPIEEYNDLLEDIHDLAMVAERIYDPNITHENVLSELKRDEYLLPD
jgi:hypothetical protein